MNDAPTGRRLQIGAGELLSVNTLLSCGWCSVRDG